MKKIFAPVLLFFLAILKFGASHETPDNGDEVVQRDITSLYRRNLQHLTSNLDENIEPCDDFFQHVCNGYKPVEKRRGVYWKREEKQNQYQYENKYENEYEDIPPFLYNEEDRMRFFEQKIYEFGTRPGEILRELYTDCKNRHRYDVIHGPAQPRWTRMLQEIPFLARRSYIFRMWPFLQFEWLNWTRRYKLNWVVLAAKFAAHGLPSLLHIFFAEGTIYIESAVKSQNCRSLDEIERSLLPLMEQRHQQIAAAIGKELWNFCNILTGAFESDFELKYNDTVRIEELFFHTFFTTLNFTEEEVEQARHIPIDLGELQRILELLLNAEPRIVFNYVLWHAYIELEYEDCYLLTKEFEELLFSEYWHWHVFSRHFKRNVALATYLFQTTRFQRHRKEVLLSADWDKFFFQKLVRRDFNIERMIRNYSSMYLETNYLMETYGEAALVNGYFYGNLLALRRSKLRAAFYQPLFDEENLNHPQYFLRQFLYFSILLLKQPFFHYFATQGFELWYASNLLYSSDGYLTALSCLEQQTLTHILTEGSHEAESDIYLILTPAEVQEIFRFHAAFIESYRDYRFWLSGEFFAFAEDFVLEYFGLDSNRMPFYATAQLYCNRNDPLYSSMINRSFMNLKEFSTAFNCSEETNMNPIVKCMNNRNCKQ